MAKSDRKYGVSVIITVSEFCSGIEDVFLTIRDKLTRMGKSFECIFVQLIDNNLMEKKIQDIARKHPDISLLRLRPTFSEADAFNAGIEHAKGDTILTLPVYHQVEVDDLDEAFEAAGSTCDIILCRRFPRLDAWLNKAESVVFNGLIRRLLKVNLHDLGCGVMVMPADVARSIDVYGDLYRFIPILALRQGYTAGEVKVRHLLRRKKSGLYGPGVYIRRLLDIVTLFFIVKFTKKPLRFFGLTGAGFFGAGSLINIYLTIYKFMGNSLANRPMLILGVIFMVLGVQLLSIGLIGELIIFTHAKKMKEYRVGKILS
ncbi:MAG: glycosyltransferase [Candidatus Omnitrophica bacterium]|nr:glycosyltransferase [Candidatus Omnitrophota bacterium]